MIPAIIHWKAGFSADSFNISINKHKPTTKIALEPILMATTVKKINKIHDMYLFNSKKDFSPLDFNM